MDQVVAQALTTFKRLAARHAELSALGADATARASLQPAATP